MDDESALLARTVARAAAAWFNAPMDYEAYRRLAAAVNDWNAYQAPQLVDLPEGDGELLDEITDSTPPTPLGEALAGLEGALRRAARRTL